MRQTASTQVATAEQDIPIEGLQHSRGAGPDYGLLGLAEEVDEEEALHDLRAECLHVGFLASAFAHHRMAGTGPGRQR